MRALAAIIAATLAMGCAATDSAEDGFVVPDGKEDDFLSLTATEYSVESRSFVTVENEEKAVRQLNARSYELKFEQTIAGRNDLMDHLPHVNGKLDLVIGKPSNEEMAPLAANHEWYRARVALGAVYCGRRPTTTMCRLSLWPPVYGGEHVAG